MKNRHGFSLIEILIVLVIFSVVMAGLYAAYSVQLKQGVQQYKLAESEMELEITKTLVERDLLMAGYGLADEYCESPTTDVTCPSGLKCTDTSLNFCVPVAISATNGTPDSLTLMGTGLGMGSRATWGWSYTETTTPALATDFKDWTTGYTVETDPRENPMTGDRIIYIEPNLRRLMVATGANSGTGGTGQSWTFAYPPAGDANKTPDLTEPGILVYGLHTDDTSTNFPFYTVGYHLSSSGSGLSTCAAGTENLLRLESRTIADPSSGGNPILNCLLDFQVAFGLDEDEDGDVDCWDNGGATAGGYSNDTLRMRLKQIKVFAFVQEGKRDRDYVYKNPDPAYSSNPERVWVGDTILTACGGGTVGREISLTAEQRKYRWRHVSLSIVPRNFR